MSIYATHWVLQFPRQGDFYTGCEWTEVIGQGVPAHIGTPSAGHGYEDGDPYAAFLPPAIPVPKEENIATLRAMVVVRAGTEKRGQEYVGPLLVLSGQEYAQLTFDDLHERICSALRDGQPRVVAEFLGGDGSTRIMFEDGSTKAAPAPSVSPRPLNGSS